MNKTEKFVEKAAKVHGDRYDYGRVEYTKNNVRVPIVCREHGVFNQTPSKHWAGQGCPECGREALAARFSHTADVFIAKAKQKHGNKYCYGGVVYKNAKTKVCIVCPLHGEFLQTPDSHLQYGCKLCGHDAISLAKFRSTEDFIERAKTVHGDTFDYSLVDYLGSTAAVRILCKKHGEFLQTPDAHLAGRGCVKCANFGYNCAKPGHFYIMSSDGVVKVGITNRDVAKRLKELQKASGTVFVLRYSCCFSDGSVPKVIETEALRMLSLNHSPVHEKFAGSTECFQCDEVDDVVASVIRLVGEGEL